MSVRRDDTRPSWRALQAASVLILCKDERDLHPRLSRRIHKWMRRSPDNLRKVLAMADLDRMLDQQKLLDRTAQLESRAGVRTPTDMARPVSAWPGFFTRRATFVAGAVATLALLLVASVMHLRTDHEPVRHVSFQDGSVMHLVRGSGYAVKFSDELRLIELSRGEAIFEVTQDPNRPFIVRTPWTDVVVTGTRFQVSIDSGITTTVSEGVVRVVAPAGADYTMGTIVKAGEEYRVIPGALQQERVTAVDAKRKLSWPNGWLMYRGETLAEAVQDFNRFNDVQIEVTQPELSRTQLGYYNFKIDAAESFARTVAAEMNWPVDYDSERKVILIGPKESTPESCCAP